VGRKVPWAGNSEGLTRFVVLPEKHRSLAVAAHSGLLSHDRKGVVLLLVPPNFAAAPGNSYSLRSATEGSMREARQAGR